MRRGLVWFLLSVTLSLTACTMWKEHPVNTWKDATGAEGLERSFWNEVKAKNWVELQKHMAGNYISVTPGGQYDRAASLEHIKHVQLEDFSLGDVTTELNGNTMVISYTLVLRGTADGQAIPSEPKRHMSVWQQQKAGWMAIAQSVVSTGEQRADEQHPDTK